jgi:tetratricopeptide (TPR) repeat protein
MADDDFDEGAKPSAQADAVALHAALGASGPSEEAREYLRKQSRLAELQIENLQKLDAFENSHLRWRRFNDQMKGALQIMTVAVGLLLVAGIAWAIWSASQADGLVVDSFSVPPSYAQVGVSGDVVADDMTSKIAAIRDFANDNSLARSNDVSEDHSRDVKVEIPATGVSLADAWNYLKRWFGHERHLTGNLRTRADGNLALTVSLGGSDSFTYTGKDLGALEQKAAEQVFADVDPINIVLYLNGKRRTAEMLAAAHRNVERAQGNADLGESYALYGNMLRYATGDVRRSLALSQLAIRLDPKAIPQHMETLNSSRLLGHDEEVLKQSREMVPLKREDNVGAWRNPSSTGFFYAKQLGAIWGYRETGDFLDLSRLPLQYGYSPGEALLAHAEATALSHDPRGAQAQIASAIATSRALSVAADQLDPEEVASARTYADVAQQNWPAAAADAQAFVDSWKDEAGFAARFNALSAQTLAVPLLAQAQARQGDFAKAWVTIDATPRDCYNCVRTRGQIAALQKNWNGAQTWFADAVKQAPSIPFAYADWGAMLMAKGDLDGAIAKFTLANQKGSHFADPLEMWGEALIAKNRSDLALAKFEEAAKYAPNWGRLHLKWGEALWWSGDKDAARKQFATAATLDLTPPEKSELTRVKHG